VSKGPGKFSVKQKGKPGWILLLNREIHGGEYEGNIIEKGGSTKEEGRGLRRKLTLGNKRPILPAKPHKKIE